MRKLALGAILIVLILVVIGLNSTPESESSAGLITMNQFNAIQTGMTYEQVSNILGKPGEEMSSSTIGDLHTIMYIWKNPMGPNMNAMFQNNKLMSKAQFGLH